MEKFKLQTFLNMNNWEFIFQIVLIYYILSSYLSGIYLETKFIFGGLIFLCLIWICKSIRLSEYASEIYVSDEELVIKYKIFLFFQSKIIRIQKNTIKSFKIVIHSKDERVLMKLGNGASRIPTSLNCCKSTILIITENNKYEISIRPYPVFNLCNYNFIFKIIDKKFLFPNLSIKVEGNSKYAWQDIENYKKQGQRISWIKTELTNKTTTEQLKLLIIMFIVCFLFFGIVILFLINVK